MNDGSWQWRSKVIQYLYKTVSSEGSETYTKRKITYFFLFHRHWKASFFPALLMKILEKYLYDGKSRCLMLTRVVSFWRDEKILPSHRAGPIELTYCIHLYKSFDWLQCWHPYCPTATCSFSLNYKPDRPFLYLAPLN